MASKQRTEVKDAAELQKEMCMSSLKRALDDVEYNGCGAEPLKKKTCLPLLPKRHIRGSTNGKKAKVGARTHCRLQSNKTYFKKAPQKHSLKTLTNGTASQGSDYEHKTEKSTDLAIKKKRSKRSADSLPNPITDECDIKKRKVDQTVTETESENGQDSVKPTNEVNASEATSDTPQQQTESPKLVSRFCGLAEYMREGSKEYLLQQNYNFRKNVAFARQIVVYASDGSEYDNDYSDVDNAICDNDDEDDDDLYDDNDLDDDDDFEDVDPDAEVVSKRLNSQIADFFKLHKDRGTWRSHLAHINKHLSLLCPSMLHDHCQHRRDVKCEAKNVPKPQVQPTELHQTSSFGMGLFCKQPINNAFPKSDETAVAGCSGVAAAAAAAVPTAAAGGGGFEHDENGNDAEEFDRASAASNNLKPVVPW